MNFTSRSLARPLCILSFAFLICLAPQFAPGALAAQTDITGPAGSGAFGTSVSVLPNGNIVVTDPGYDIISSLTIADVGAVYLYNGTTGALISTLTGSTANNQVGSSGVVVLPNGNYVVLSPNWDNGAIADAGAVTWCNGTIGCVGVVSPANSLVGTTTNDNVGNNGVTALPNGNYVVSSPNWDNSTIYDAGAATWCNGTTGCVGVVSPTNSLVGSTTRDFIGNNGVEALTNGNYVVSSRNWSNGATASVGAVTWCNGTAGCAGAISPTNSLVGSTERDAVGNGYGGVAVLPNGNYVVLSPNWDNGAIADAGAVTWCNGTIGCVGVVSPINSLVGTTANDNVGNGYDGVTALPNGNYVVSSPNWDNGTIYDAGAATWCNRTTGCVGVVSPTNSLVGSTGGDVVGEHVTTLTNGNYVVSSSIWNNGTIYDAGAVTWCSGTGGCAGAVSPTNSLAGNKVGDLVGRGGVTALTNGNYVVSSWRWYNSATSGIGAVTWCNGIGGCVGAVSAANSLVGGGRRDSVGEYVAALTNGNYVVSSPLWDNGAAYDAGAATFCGAAAGCVGGISSANSLVGSKVGDFVGGYVVALTNGNYIVRSLGWDNGTIAGAGAVTWCSGTIGCAGAVAPRNSLVGTTLDDLIGEGGMTALPNGNYVVRSPLWDNGDITDAGAITLGTGASPTVGPITAANSVLGTAVSGGRNMVFAYDAVNEQLVVGRPASNIVSLFRLADTTPPVVSSINRANAEQTSQNMSVRFTVTFSEAVTGVDASDFRLFTTGNLSGVAITGVSGSEMTYTVTVNTGSGAGTLRLDLSDDDTITDAQNNRLGGTGAGNGNFTNGQAYTVPLALTINDVTRAEGNSGTSVFVFTVSLSAPAPAGGVSFDLTTADNTATVADNDYEPKSVAGASIAAGSQTFEFTVTVNGDTKQETNETFHVNVSNVAGASVSDGQGTGTLQNDEGMPGGGQILISEFRLHGPGAEEQATDEFIELYNNTDSDFIVMDSRPGGATDGWALVSSDTPRTPKFVIPAGTRLPARGHFLIAHGTGYSLGLYPAGRDEDGETTAIADGSYFVNIPADAGLALFRTGNPVFFNVAERLDAVGPITESNLLFKEGSGYAPVTATGRQHSFLRDLRSALPKDTDRNERDFLYVDTQGSLDPSADQQLGAPGPENSRSAVQRNNTLKASLIEPQASSASPPNRLRDGAATGSNATFGTLEIRRRFTNRTRATVNFLRLRVVDITTLGTPNAGGAQADLRWLDSTDIEVATSLGELTVRGTMIETPPGQPHGGGLNSSARIVPVAPLSSGASMDVRILLGVQRNGSFRLLFNVEASEQTDAQTETRTSRLKGRTKQQ